MKFGPKFLFPVGLVGALGATLAAAPQSVYRAASDFWGARYTLSQAPPAQSKTSQGNDGSASSRIRHWNETAVNASGLDHTPVAPGENRVFGEQVGPVRAARAIAIVHIAIFEAVNAIDGLCKSYVGMAPAPADTSMNCAIAQAAHDTLCAMFPSQRPTFDTLLTKELGQVPNGRTKKEGVMLGQRCAAKVLALRANDGSAYIEPHVGTDFIPS